MIPFELLQLGMLFPAGRIKLNNKILTLWVDSTEIKAAC